MYNTCRINKKAPDNYTFVTGSISQSSSCLLTQKLTRLNDFKKGAWGISLSFHLLGLLTALLLCLL